jgi:methionyl-tRNA synthetase
VPEPGELRPADKELLATIEAGFQSVGEQLEGVHLRAALAEAVRLATEVNKYLDTNAPWFEIKTDKTQAAKSVYTALRAIDSLKVMFAPFLPYTSEKLHTYLGYDKPLFGAQNTEKVTDDLGEHVILRYQPAEDGARWQPSQLSGGAALQPPQPLFRKLESKIIAEERARLGQEPQ